MLKYLIFIFFLPNIIFGDISKKILKNDNQSLIIKIDINAITESDIYPTKLIIGLPSNNLPKTKITFSNKSNLPFKTKQIKPNDLNDFEWINQQKIKGLETGTIKISPLANQKEYFKQILVELTFETIQKKTIKANKAQTEFLKTKIINWNMAKSWFIKKINLETKKIITDNGRWLNFHIYEDGMKSIPFSSLEPVVNDISLIDPRSISLFMHNSMGRSKNHTFNQPINDNLIEINIEIEGEDDGSFDENDKIIFYGRSSSGFDIENLEYKWNQNLYFTSNICWLYIPNNSNLRGKRVTDLNQPSDGILIDYGLVSFHLEPDLINLESSGTEWLWSPISSGNSHTILLNLPNPKNGVNFTTKSRFRGNSQNQESFSQHNLSILFGSLNGDQIGSNLSWSGSASRISSEVSNNIDLNNGTNLFYIKNSSNDFNSYPYIDYFEIKYGRILNFSNSYQFLSPLTNQNVKLSFTGTKPRSTRLWNITNPKNASSIAIDDDGFCYIYASDSLNLYILFDKANINPITDLNLIESNEFNYLRNNSIQSNYIIIGPKSFKEQTSELINLRSPAIYADLETIYKEFSGGNPDPMALRTFVQWTQENWLSPQPNYLLLLGDSGYDYRNINGSSTIIVPTFQVQASRSYATDDLISSIYGNIPELATGRFPAKNQTEVSNFIQKILEIENNPSFGLWRQNITLIADDAARPEPNHGSISTGKSHTLNSEQLANIIPLTFYINKLYMIEYPEVTDASAYGVIKPEATEAFLNQLNSGTAIISYIGHGSPTQLAQEKLLDLNRGDLNQINTGKKLPLWIVGTCSFGHFDDPQTESFSEELIRSPMNAASMVISTSRPITVTGNERYTKELFESIFPDKKPSNQAIGILLQSIKDGTNESQYFHLFGDPAMKIPIPIDSILIKELIPDTLKTLQVGVASIEQSIIDGDGNGYIILTDANREVTREYEISSETYSLTYNLPGATLFRGLFSFSNELFNTQIRIPKDISYSYDPGKITVYLHNENKEALGYLNNIIIVGGDETNDILGPIINFETTSGKILSEGDHFYFNENLLIKLSDPMGINITNEIGHEIKIVDLETNNYEIVTDDFYYDQNSITNGSINYQTNLKQNIHIKVKAWDNANNPSEKSVKLSGIENDILKIYNSYNYPNPFKTTTQFSFEITRNSDIKLDIYTLEGRNIKKFKYLNIKAGYHIINWDGKDRYGGKIARGVYLYRIKATNDNSTISYIGKCAKY